METTLRTFAEVLKGLEPADRTVKEFKIATACGVRPATVIQWRLGYRNPDQLARREICGILNEEVTFPPKSTQGNGDN